MSTTVIKPWVESVTLHPDVVSPNFSEDISALDLGPLADGNKNVPAGKRVKPEVGTGAVRVVGTWITFLKAATLLMFGWSLNKA